MKISIDKARVTIVSLAAGALLMIGALLNILSQQTAKLNVLEAKLAKESVRVAKVIVVTPMATPTASLKFYPTKGIVK